MATWKDLPASPAATSARHAPLKNLQKKLSNALLQHKSSNTSLSSDREASDKSSSLSAEDRPLLLQQPRQATTGSSKRDSFLDHLNQNPEPFKLSPAPPGRHPQHLASLEIAANESDQDNSRRQKAEEEVAFFTASKAARTLGLGTSPAIMESHRPHYRDLSGRQLSRSPAPSSPSDYFGTAPVAETETLDITSAHYPFGEDQSIPPYCRAVTSPSTFESSKMSLQETQQRQQQQPLSEKAPLPIAKGSYHSIYQPTHSFQQQGQQRPSLLTRQTSPNSSDRSHIRSESSPVPAQGSSSSAQVKVPSPPFSAGLYPPSAYSQHRPRRQPSKLSRPADEAYSPDREQDELEAFFTVPDTDTSSADSLPTEDIGSLPPAAGPIAPHSLRKLATSRKRQQSAPGTRISNSSNALGQERTHFQLALDALEGRGSASERGTGSAPQSTGSRFSDSGSEDDSASPDEDEPDEETRAEAQEADGTTHERPPSIDEHQTVCSACTSICTERLDVSTQTTSFDTTDTAPSANADDEQEALAAKAQRLEQALQESVAHNEELKQALSSSSNRQQC